MGMPIHAVTSRSPAVKMAVPASTATTIKSKRLRWLGSDQILARRTSCGLYARLTVMSTPCAGK